MKVGFIGAGKVGTSLGKYFSENNISISGFYSEFLEDSKFAANFCKGKYYENETELVKDSDIIFITVPDSYIKKVWQQLVDSMANLEGKFICHCSGAMSSEVFLGAKQKKCFAYSIHPLFAVSDKEQSYKELSHSYFVIEGDETKIHVIENMFKDLGNKVCTIDKKNKTKYHASASIASNLVVGLINLSQRLLIECGFEEDDAKDALSPIITGNVEHIIKDGTVNALTGPIERGDTETVKKHMNVLEGQDLLIYKSCALEVLNVAKIKNIDRDYSEMEELLK